MQVSTDNGLIHIANGRRPAISVSIAPKTPPGYLMTGLALGLVFGFVLGSVATLLIGEKSLVLAQHLWNRLTGVNDEGDRVHFELLLQ